MLFGDARRGKVRSTAAVDSARRGRGVTGAQDIGDIASNSSRSSLSIQRSIGIGVGGRSGSYQIQMRAGKSNEGQGYDCFDISR